LKTNLTYIKNIRQYLEVSTSDKNQIYTIFNNYVNAKNYIYSRYSGIKSINIINNHKKEIRDIWTQSDFIDIWGINRRFIRNAIDDAVANIKSNWSNLKIKLRKIINKNKNLSKTDKHYINYILKSDKLLYNVLNKIEFKIEKFEGLNVKKLNKYINRIVRKYKPNISNSKKLTMIIDSEMYSYKDNTFMLMGLVKNKRILLKPNNNKIFDSSLRLTYNQNNNTITVNKAEKNKVKYLTQNTEIIGIDKNYINVIDTSKETSYGIGLNDKQKHYTNVIKNINSKRNYYRRKLKENHGDKKKIDNINKNNLGVKKYNKVKNKFKEEIKKVINKAINDFIEIDKPKIIVVEDLTFVYSKHSNRVKKQSGYINRGKKVNLYLSGWLKGYIQERLEYKGKIHNIEIKEINAAYTSQICNHTGNLGYRKGELFYCQKGDKGVHSGHNAAKNILDRYYDKEILLDMTAKDVKAIIEKRLVDKNIDVRDNIYVDKPNQPRPLKNCGANS